MFNNRTGCKYLKAISIKNPPIKPKPPQDDNKWNLWPENKIPYPSVPNYTDISTWTDNVRIPKLDGTDQDTMCKCSSSTNNVVNTRGIVPGENCTPVTDENKKPYGVCTSLYNCNPLVNEDTNSEEYTTKDVWFDECCTVTDCLPTGRFNWILATCLNPSTQDTLCGCSSSKSDSWEPITSDIIVNYVGTYQYNMDKSCFELVKDSSFNCNGTNDPWDPSNSSVQENWCKGGNETNGSWMPGPNPGGAANWGEGYYPAGRTGAGPPAMAFILSVDKIVNSCFYALNQSDLDTGPTAPPSGYPQNTWGCNNSGEFDIIEPVCAGGSWQAGFGLKDAYNGSIDGKEYIGYTTGWTGANLGQYGRCLFWSLGQYGGQKGGGGWGTSNKGFIMDSPNSGASNPRVFLCVIDRVGMRTYQIPTGKDNDGKYWKGITQKTCPEQLCPYPLVEPQTTTAELFKGGTDSTDSRKVFCANFIPATGTTDPNFIDLSTLPKEQEVGEKNSFLIKYKNVDQTDKSQMKVTSIIFVVNGHSYWLDSCMTYPNDSSPSFNDTEQQFEAEWDGKSSITVSYMGYSSDYPYGISSNPTTIDGDLNIKNGETDSDKPYPFVVESVTSSFPKKCTITQKSKYRIYPTQPTLGPVGGEDAGVDRGYCSNFFQEKFCFLGEKSLWEKASGLPKSNDGFDLIDPNCKDINGNNIKWYANMESPPDNSEKINDDYRKNTVNQYISKYGYEYLPSYMRNFIFEKKYLFKPE